MNKLVKRVLTFMLCLAMVLTMVPAVFAAEELFDISGSTMTLGNTLELNFVIDTARLEGEDNYAEISINYADERGTVKTQIPQSQWKEYDGSSKYVSYCVCAKEMMDELSVAVYSVGGQQLSNTYTDSVASYAYRVLEKSDNDKLKVLAVDMLNYGTAAQIKFGYNTTELANGMLTEEQKALATVVTRKENKQVKGTGLAGSTLTLEENILLNFVYENATIDQVSYAQVSFTDHYGEMQNYTIDASQFVTYDATRKYVQVDTLVVADRRQLVTVELCDAESGVISTSVDSVESYTARANNELFDNILAFGDGAYNYFHTSAPEQSENMLKLTTSVATEDGQVSETATFGNEEVSAQVPTGVQVESNTLTLTITEKESSDSGVVPEAGQELLPLDIHMEGISAENVTPIQICLGKILPGGLNIGNVTLYHVEDGVSNTMTRVMALTELDEHNEFHYDPATGDITVAMATFSEVALVSEDAKWEGEVDHSWYDAEKTQLTIANADQLWSFSQIVGGMAEDIRQDSFDGKTVKLITDIDLDDAEGENDSNKIFYPIGYFLIDGDSGVDSFSGTFDGQGHTISNFYQNTWEMKGDYDGTYYNDAMGLFGKVYGGTVKNLTVQNFSSDGENTATGVIAAYADFGATFENIAIFNCNPKANSSGNGGIVGCVGWFTTDETTDKVTFKSINVDSSNKISALEGAYDVACGGIVGQYYPTSGQRDAVDNAGIYMENCHIAAQMDVYNDVCADCQYYAYRYAGMLIGSVRENENVDGCVYPKMDGITAKDCTVRFGDWNDYYYCELVDNTMASYTHDYRMSRLVQVKEVNGTAITYLDGTADTVPATGRVNYVVVTKTKDDGTFDHGTENATCYHFLNGAVWTHDMAGVEEGIDENGDGEIDLKEDKQCIYLEFHNLISGYNWGVTSKSIGEMTGVTILDGETAASVAKFEGIAEGNQYITGTGVTIGELFKSAKAEADIDIDNVRVFVFPADENSSVTATYTANTTDWTRGILIFSGTGEATITITDHNYCIPTTIKVTVENRKAEQKFETKFTGDFLYRVGNVGTVALGTMFDKASGCTGEIGTVAVTVENIAGNAAGVYTANATWTSGTIQFSGTGVVKVTITDNDYCTPTELNLEVVDAKNVTSASFSGNTVLLNDVYPTSTLSTSGIIYGNGFTVNMENAPISEKNGAVFHLHNGAILKNLNIIGKEFTSVSLTVNNTDYGVSAVKTWGTVVIENCYISGCRSAVSAIGSELTIKDSVIANGVYANIDFGSGILNLHNVTTINEPHCVNGTTIVGLGIVGNMTASAGRQINITGTLTQYNWLSKADFGNIKADGVSTVFNSVFTDSKYAAFRYTYNGTTYVNTGILSLCSDFLAAGVPVLPTDYLGKDVKASIGGVSTSGYVWAPGQSGTLTDADMKYHDKVYTHTSTNQGTSYIPSNFSYTAAGLEQENNVLQISYESGSAYTLSNKTLKALFNAKKYGQALSYTIFMNGVDYTNKDIVFDAAASQNYTITYTVTDNLVYDKDGTLSNKTYQVEKQLKVFATVVDKGADAPAFTFYYGTKGSASAGTPHTSQPTTSYAGRVEQIDSNTYYVMPDVNATSANAIGSKTENGKTVYYPIVDGINVRSGSSNDYDYTRYYPLFKAVTISDNGTAYSYSGTKEMPATVSWVSAQIDTGNGATPVNDGFGLYNNQYLCKIQKKAGDAESGGTSVVKFSYTALDGFTYIYYVGFRFYDESEGCVTGDTLITLADGTQVRVDALTGNEELLVWNLETGSYDTAPIVFVDSDAEREYEVVNLHFSDGSKVGVIYEHGFFDYDLGKYIYLHAGNAERYIGHRFVTQGDISGNTWNTATLTDVVIETKVAIAYSPVTFSHLCYYTDGVLSMPGGIEGLFNIFDVDTDLMAYDADKKAQDIETYGLYTYEDFAGIIPEEAFYAFNGAYLKVAIEKGLLTWEDIEHLAQRYVPLM